MIFIQRFKLFIKKKLGTLNKCCKFFDNLDGEGISFRVQLKFKCLSKCVMNGYKKLYDDVTVKKHIFRIFLQLGKD